MMIHDGISILDLKLILDVISFDFQFDLID